MYNWTDEYREIVEQFWWEPQRFGRAATNPKKFPTADTMWESVGRLEQALNHILNIFFALYPIEKLDLGIQHDNYKMISSRRLDELERNMKNATQPDLYFLGDGSHTAIELKTKSRSSLDQVKKYIAFSNYIDADAPLYLIYLTPHESIDGVFEERYTDEQELHAQLSDAENIKLHLTFMSLHSFDTMLTEVHPDNQIEAKLLDGIRGYMQEYFKRYLH